MSYTTPRTYVAGELHTAAHHNVWERDNIAWLATDSPCCRAWADTDFTVATGTDAYVPFAQEKFDNAAVHSTAGSTTRLSCPAGGDGKYLIGAFVSFESVGGGIGGTSRSCGFRLNGGEITEAWLADSVVTDIDYDLFPVRIAPATMWSLVVGDYVECRVRQDAPSLSLNILSTLTRRPAFWMIWLRT